MASTRLRKTFHYPSESDSDDPSDLDEEHQETLIDALQTRDLSTNAFYRRAFLPLPLLALLLYIPQILVPTALRAWIIALLSLTSLAGTAWILYFLPVHKEDLKGKRAVYKGDPRGPVERYIVALNGALSLVLALAAIGAWRRGFVDEFWRGVLPGGELVPLACSRY